MSKSANGATGSPSALGYRMPAEWEPHAATWIAWPHYRGDWPGKFEPIAWVYAEIARHLSASERLNIIVQNSAGERAARGILRAASVDARGIRFHRWATDRVWVRDSGPIFVVREQVVRENGSRARRVALTAWGFNAWAKYNNFKHDAKLPARIGARLDLPMFRAMRGSGGAAEPVVLEGGSIDVNGRGAMLATEECLLSQVQRRNPGLGRKELEQIFASYLGISKTIWLGRGIAGDDTHGHVDDIARFVAPHTVVAAVERDASDVNYLPLQENLRRLRRASDERGRRLQVFELPMPAPIFFKSRRLPASYANFYIANKAVLAPVFNDPNDRVALNLLAQLFPGRDVVGIYSGDLIWGLGAMHCLTQQQPK